MTLQVEKVGHLVLRVRNLDDAVAFYRDVLGVKDVARGDFGEGPMAFLSTGNSHHDLALLEASEVGNRRTSRLHHFALKVGDTMADLLAAKDHLEAVGVPVHTAIDHRVSQSIYTSDSDGNLIELYVDADDEAWRDDPSLVARADPLVL